MTTFANRLKAAMEQAQVSQTDLHVRTGISKASISQYLSGKNEPSKARITTLAETLGVDEDYLTGYEVPMTTGPAAMSPVRTPGKITLLEAARCMGKSVQFVREGLKRGILPFGDAVPGSGSKYIYFISPDKFRAYVGEDLFTSYFGVDKAG